MYLLHNRITTMICYKIDEQIQLAFVGIKRKPQGKKYHKKTCKFKTCNKYINKLMWAKSLVKAESRSFVF